MEYESLFKAARQAGTLLAETETERLGRTLMHAAQLLRTHTPRLLEANARDLEAMASRLGIATTSSCRAKFLRTVLP